MYSDWFYLMLFCSAGGGKSEGAVDLGWQDDEIWNNAEEWDDEE